MRCRTSEKSSTPCLRSVRWYCSQRDGEQPVHRAREHEVDVLAIGVQRIDEIRAERGDGREMALVVARRAELGLLVGQALARLAVLRQHVIAETLEQRLRHRRPTAADRVSSRCRSRASEQRSPDAAGPVARRPPTPPGTLESAARSRASRRRDRTRRSSACWALRAGIAQRVPGDEPTIDQPRQALRAVETRRARRRAAPSRVRRWPARGRREACDRAPRRPGAASRFRRRGRSRDRRRPRAETRAAARGRTRRSSRWRCRRGSRESRATTPAAMRLVAMAPRQFVQDALPHLGRGLARERDREDVARLDAGQQQADVAIDQHARLAGAGRGFERDVSRRIDRLAPRLGVAGFARIAGVEIEPCLPIGHGSLSGGAPRRISSRQTVRYGQGPHRLRRAGRGGKTPAAMSSSVSSSRVLRVGDQLVESSGPSRRSGTTGLVALEREIQRFGERPVAAARGAQRLERDEAVDRQLQRLLQVGRLLRLVVDDAQRPVRPARRSDRSWRSA